MIQFLPWEPTGSDPRIHGVRLLLLGESHYEEGDEAGAAPEVFTNLTRTVVRRWGREPEGRQVFFANIFTLLTGERWSREAEVAAIWDNVFFYNYVQALVPGGARHRPSGEMWRESKPGFQVVLERLRPQVVIALGEDLWQNMPDAAEVVREPEHLGLVCRYVLADGSPVLAAHTRHPSSNGFSAMAWNPRVRGFLDWARTYAEEA